MLHITTPKENETLSLLTTVQKEFLQMDRSGIQGTHFDWLDLKRQDKTDFSFPEPVSFSWEPAVPATLEISEDEQFSAPVFRSGEGKCSVSGLKIGTRYFCRVVGEGETSPVISFQTDDAAPRFLWIDGITNVRDCGGWTTMDGKHVAQGLLYRGSEMNSHVSITDAGLQTLRQELQLRSVLDIRGATEIVEDIYRGGYVNIPCEAYDAYLNDPETHRRIFEFLAEKENYPVYFHCWGGADRTGTIAFLLNAILGVPESQLIDDYELTSLSIWGVRTRNSDLFCSFRRRLNEFEGETVNDKALNFTLSCGVSMEKIRAFRAIMLSV